jgi:hypothetical protein
VFAIIPNLLAPNAIKRAIVLFGIVECLDKVIAVAGLATEFGHGKRAVGRTAHRTRGSTVISIVVFTVHGITHRVGMRRRKVIAIVVKRRSGVPTERLQYRIGPTIGKKGINVRAARARTQVKGIASQDTVQRVGGIGAKGLRAILIPILVYKNESEIQCVKRLQ